MTEIPRFPVFELSGAQALQGTSNRVGFCELRDSRILAACQVLLDESSLRIVLVGSAGDLAALPSNFRTHQRVELIDVAAEAGKTRKVIEQLSASRGKSKTQEELQGLSDDPAYCLGALISRNKVDAGVAGCVFTTSHVIRAALSTVGLKENANLLSSSFLFCSGKNSTSSSTSNLTENWFLFADCGVNPKPTPEQFAEITSQSVEKWETLFEQSPHKVAFLSYATGDSARGELVDKVRAAKEQTAKIFSENRSDIDIVGPVQFDAAFVPAIGAKKGIVFKSDKPAEIYLFPDLNSANIAYKIANHVGQYHAFGPLLQGLAKPFTDCSRGASVEEIVGSAVITAIEAARGKSKK